MKFEIKNRFSGAVQFECELTAEIAEKSYSVRLGFAVKKAIEARADLEDAYLARADLEDAYLARADLARANLEDAYLAGAYLAGAYLADANLAGANLAGAYLADANLAGADLAGADLEDAYLARADLAGAYLADANLAGADLAGADLAGADLAGADLEDAYLARANLAGANLAGARNVPDTNGSESIQEPADRAERQRQRAQTFRERFPDVPVVESLDAKILAAIDAGGHLKMDSWHTCETTHCRAGWAIMLAGEAGKELETRYGSEDAGRRIYLASTGRVPWFFDSNEGALADIREQAALMGAGGG